ncbi:hypothetical protein [Pontimicrobium aquaticum]|uniref:Long-chain fatty acid transport protein n=1 Tax=Pontimicrobium aquaticum TaxID=2565367 RepID=A0A4V5LR34_9FLAO|nr:hypothetical protein [Pontimicrobium aquaticum]TJY37689.1 hypothetical protein E5167_00085 [Pontimicrobium aquaticum]
MRKLLCLIILAFFALNIHAQEGTTSPYSFYGIGSLKFKGTVENVSMGGLSIYTDSIHVNLRNPASYAGSFQNSDGEGQIIKFAVGGSSSNTTLKTNSASDKTNATTFDYLALSLPMGRLGMSFGLMPYTSVGYKLISVKEENILDYRYNGEGGLNKAFLGIGYLISENLKIGIDASYNFGNIENSVVNFRYDDEGDPLLYHSKEVNRSELSGINFNLGLSYTPMISEKLQLTSSLSFSPKADLTSTNQRNFATVVIGNTGQDITVNEIEADLEALNLDKTVLTLPTKTAFGLGLGEKRKWFLGAEYTFLKTSEFSNEIFSFDNTTYENASTISVGGFFIPQYNSFSYWKRVVYRAGMRFENTGLNIQNESINEFGMSFGVGLPVGRMFNNVNIGLEVGQRGTIKQNLVKENFVNFQISLSFNDRWFQKRKFD